MDGIRRSEEVILLSSNLKRFTFNELKTATLNFHPDNEFEAGDFGPIFKGWIEEKGTRMAVAVKRLGYMHIEWMVSKVFYAKRALIYVEVILIYVWMHRKK
ncbi:hypothetical protein QJS04_geneDACA015023 [Acorus gramineus]|uniref:Uncharacterized protein n=1 Tax=Acorus gramineus TaxID=55184 RepID=A0AAV9BX67_ACOGR|nr:hypothetical protein QJS04_geneDACA015023 [Acorus gramineus]